MSVRHITTADGVRLAAECNGAGPDVSGAPGALGRPRGTVLIAPATGVVKEFYAALAAHIASLGFAVLRWDPRGVGGSKTGPARHSAGTMLDWAVHDLQAVIRYAQSAQAPDAKLLLIGHSSGGHLAGLAPSITQLHGLALISAGSGDWRVFPPLQWPRLWATWWLATPLLLAVYGYAPAWAGVGHDMPPGVVRQWRRWCLQRGYLFSDLTLDLSGYKNFRAPILALSMADDRGYTPPSAMRALLAQFVNAPQQHHVLQAPAGGPAIGHFGFFKPRHRALWPVLDEWLLRVAA